jgi:hypothetical protein
MTTYLEDNVLRQVQRLQRQFDKITQDSDAVLILTRNDACDFVGVTCDRPLQPIFSVQGQRILEMILNWAWSGLSLI